MKLEQNLSKLSDKINDIIAELYYVDPSTDYERFKALALYLRSLCKQSEDSFKSNSVMKLHRCKEFIQIVWILPNGARAVLQQIVPADKKANVLNILYIEDREGYSKGLKHNPHTCFTLRNARNLFNETYK